MSFGGKLIEIETHSPTLDRRRPNPLSCMIALMIPPMLFYDLVRLARRRQLIGVRCLYATGILLLVTWQYLDWGGRLSFSASLPAGRQLSFFAEQFFNKFMIFQFLFIFFLVPAATAGGIAEEKQRRTLEFLLTTSLSNRDIVLSKLLSRLAGILLVVLTSLPILSLLQLWGGVDPNLVLAGFAVTGLTILSLTSFSILCSVYANRPWDAIVLSYGGIVSYLILCKLLDSIPAIPAAVKHVINGGNILAVLGQLGQDIRAGRNLATVLPGVVRAYATIHLAIAAVSVAWAIVRIRSIATQSAARARIQPKRQPPRPCIGGHPMVWKEVFVEPALGRNWAIHFVLALILMATAAPISGIVITPVVWARWFRLGQRPPLATSFGDPLWTNMWVRLAGTLLLCLLLLAMAARAAGSLSRERDRETLDALLASPLESHDILFGKWLGSFLSVRWAMIWLGVIWGVGLVLGALSPESLILLIATWISYAACFAGIGLLFSTVCRTIGRAILYTLAACLLLSVGHWVIWMYITLMTWGQSARGSFSYLWGLHFGLTPPAVLYWLASPLPEFDRSLYREQLTLCAMVGLIAWCLLTAVLWGFTRSYFRRISSRMPYRRPAQRDDTV